MMIDERIRELEKKVVDRSRYPDTFEGDCQRTADAKTLRTMVAERRLMVQLRG